MLVQYIGEGDSSRYFSLEHSILYRVLGIASPLVAEKTPEAILVRAEDQYPQATCTPFSKLEIIDDTLEEGWTSSLLMDTTIDPTIVLGYSELVKDPFMFVRLHDLNETEEDMEVLFRYYRSYGRNVPIGNYNPDDEARLREVERRILAYLQNLGDSEFQDDQSHQLYLSDFRTLTVYILHKIINSTSSRERQLYARKLQRFSSGLAVIERLPGVFIDEDLSEVLSGLRDPFNHDNLISKALKKEYSIQK